MCRVENVKDGFLVLGQAFSELMESQEVDCDHINASTLPNLNQSVGTLAMSNLDSRNQTHVADHQ